MRRNIVRTAVGTITAACGGIVAIIGSVILGFIIAGVITCCAGGVNQADDVPADNTTLYCPAPHHLQHATPAPTEHLCTYGDFFHAGYNHQGGKWVPQ